MFKKRGGHNVKEPDFFLVVLFCFVCLFVFCLKGGEHASRGNGGSISRYQLSTKGELQRIDSQ